MPHLVCEALGWKIIPTYFHSIPLSLSPLPSRATRLSGCLTTGIFFKKERKYIDKKKAK
jgi:hypothetical protein